jgi:hypothetical protein
MSYKLITLSCHAKAGGNGRAERVARETIATIFGDEVLDTHKYLKVNINHGDVEVLTDCKFTALAILNKRGKLQRELGLLHKKRQLSGFFIHSIINVKVSS